jgi:DnaJ homolog subfamily C member 3
MRDYYKILDVPRTATDKEIKKAYRKKAQEWHPDKYRGDLPAKEVEKKMSEINLAWDVLGNEERRRNYDNGEDPNVTYCIILGP